MRGWVGATNTHRGGPWGARPDLHTAGLTLGLHTLFHPPRQAVATTLLCRQASFRTHRCHAHEPSQSSGCCVPPPPPPRTPPRSMTRRPMIYPSLTNVRPIATQATHPRLSGGRSCWALPLRLQHAEVHARQAADCTRRARARPAQHFGTDQPLANTAAGWPHPFYV